MLKLIGFVVLFVCLVHQSSSSTITKRSGDTGSPVSNVQDDSEPRSTPPSILRRKINTALSIINTQPKVATKSISGSSETTSVSSDSEFNKLGQFLGSIFVTIFLANFLYIEMFAIADGTHLFFPEDKSETVEKEHRAIAIAAVEQWMKLDTMQRVEEILVNASAQTAVETFPKFENPEKLGDPAEFQRGLVRLAFNKIEPGYKADPVLYKEFSDLKQKIIQQNLPPIGKLLYPIGKNESAIDLKQVESFLSTYPKKRTIFVNRVFIMYAIQDFSEFNGEYHFNRSVTARSIIKLATEPTTKDQVQSIYNEALEKVVKSVGNGDNCTVEEQLMQYSNLLFEALSELFEKQPALNSKLKTTEEQIFASNVASNGTFKKRTKPNKSDGSCTENVPYVQIPIHRYQTLILM